MTNKNEIYLTLHIYEELLKIFNTNPTSITFYNGLALADSPDEITLQLKSNVDLTNKIACQNVKIALLEKEAIESKKKDEKIAKLEGELANVKKLLFLSGEGI